MTLVGVLAVQGAVRAHCSLLEAAGAEALEVRTPAQLCEVDALVLPGGESTAISMALERGGLADPLRVRLAEGMAAFGTCAGMILLATEVLDGRADQRAFAAIDVTVRRNAFGRQAESFEAPLELSGLDGDSFPGVFIRAPWVEAVGSGVDVLASVQGRPVACRSGRVLVTAFHPELTADDRLHAYWLENCCV